MREDVLDRVNSDNRSVNRREGGLVRGWPSTESRLPSLNGPHLPPSLPLLTITGSGTNSGVRVILVRVRVIFTLQRLQALTAGESAGPFPASFQFL